MSHVFFGKLVAAALLGLFSLSCQGQDAEERAVKTYNKEQVVQPAIVDKEIKTGADRIAAYLPLITNKRVAVMVNQTSEVNGIPLPDTLLALGIAIKKIFSPEHGFRGTADAGATVKDGMDALTGLPVISLYGNNKKPTAAQLQDVDVVIYDLQDVGARFYTYISSLQYLMEACAENGKSLIILDRPNPLGSIVDGPVLEPAHASFVGKQSIPVIYGMTAGEYAQMLLGENWVDLPHAELQVITCENYTHHSRYVLPVAPSPNLKTMAAVYLYPSLCLFEGTVISVGRGTDMPFQQFGHPQLEGYTYSFRPRSVSGALKPLYKDQTCYGVLIATDEASAVATTNGQLQLKWLIDAYRVYPDKANFFNNFFVKLAGTSSLKEQIQAGKTEKEIRESWADDLNQFKTIRKKYLLYEE